MSHWKDDPALYVRLAGILLRTPRCVLVALASGMADHDRILLVRYRYRGDHHLPERAAMIDYARRRAWLGDADVGLADLERTLASPLWPRSASGR